jgi:hypothetical protein
MAAGASALMEKPVEPAALLKTIREVLSEGKETQLRRLCGYEGGTRHIPKGRASVTAGRHDHF